MGKTHSEKEIESLLIDDPGNPLFADLAEVYRERAEYEAGMRVCFSGLSANPSCCKGRLVLARIFFALNYIPFAVRELEVIASALPENEVIKKLLIKFSRTNPSESKDAVSDTVAESDFNIDDIELIEDEK